MFGTTSFGSSHRPRNSYVIIRAKLGADGNTIWFGKLLALVHIINYLAPFSSPQYALLQYMDRTKPLDTANDVLGCISLRWSTHDEKDHICNSNTRVKIQPSPWYDLVPAASELGTIQVVRQNYAVKTFCKPVNWVYHRFYINRVYTDPLRERLEE